MTSTVFNTLPKLSEKEFRQLGSFIHEKLGIKMPGQKKRLVEARLQKRLKNLGISSFAEYTRFFFSKTGFKNEQQHLIDAITTNKTGFFGRAPILTF